MSSALHFLLDQKAPHGFGRASLIQFLEPISKELSQLSTLEHIKKRRDPFDLPSFIRGFERIELGLEERVLNPAPANGQRARDIDLIVRFFSEVDSLSPEFVIALENKISDIATTDDQQLRQEYEFLRATLDADYSQQQGIRKVPIVFIYLTPNGLTDKARKQWDCLELPEVSSENCCDFKVCYAWRKGVPPELCSATCYEISKQLLVKEQQGIINPASSYASLFLRSLIKFIDNDFSAENQFQDWDQPRGDNVRQEISEGEFWGQWRERFPLSEELAKHVFEVIKEKFISVSGERNIQDVRVVPTKTRIGFFHANTRKIGIFFQNPTTNGRIHLGFKPAPLKDREAVLRELRDKYEGEGIAVEFSGADLTLTISVGVRRELLDQLLTRLVQELP